MTHLAGQSFTKVKHTKMKKKPPKRFLFQNGKFKLIHFFKNCLGVPTKQFSQNLFCIMC